MSYRSDGSEVVRAKGKQVRLVLVLASHDRQMLDWVSAKRSDAEPVNDLMMQTVEYCPRPNSKAFAEIEWLLTMASVKTRRDALVRPAAGI
jgi:hypothetical protein